jgi:hypothetical protein
MVSCWLHIARLVKQDPGFRIGGPVSSERARFQVQGDGSINQATGAVHSYSLS